MISSRPHHRISSGQMEPKPRHIRCTTLQVSVISEITNRAKTMVAIHTAICKVIRMKPSKSSWSHSKKDTLTHCATFSLHLLAGRMTASYASSVTQPHSTTCHFRSVFVRRMKRERMKQQKAKKVVQSDVKPVEQRQKLCSESKKCAWMLRCTEIRCSVGVLAMPYESRRLMKCERFPLTISFKLPAVSSAPQFSGKVRASMYSLCFRWVVLSLTRCLASSQTKLSGLRCSIQVLLVP
mmetsp:Transcript_58632/g.139581  ORF Transcript_58632/g.139581 Transcript_58632/m.139581 type:complete len:238 (+) Transcript_58632:958-1671(+)